MVEVGLLSKRALRSLLHAAQRVQVLGLGSPVRLASNTTEVVDPTLVPEAVVPVDAAPKVEDKSKAVEPWSSAEAAEGPGVGAEVVAVEVGADAPVDA